MDSAVIGKTGDESAFQKGAEILNSGPIDVADRLQRDTLLRPRPGDSPVYPNRRGEIAIGSHISVPKNDSSDLALLRRRMRGKQPMRHSKILQQRSNEAIRHRNEKWNGERYPCANNNSNIDSDKDSTGKTVKEVEAERKSKTNVAKDSSMPPPNKEMTDLLLLQRQNRIIGLQNPMFRAQIAMQEERDHEVQVEIPAQMRRWTISKTNASKDGTTTVAISDTDEEESMTMTCDTVMYSRTLPYNPDGYHFTNLPDGTPMYSSLPPFRSLSTGDQEGKKKDIATSNKSEEKNEEKDDASLTKANYFAPLQISFHTMGGKQDGILFISKSSIGPLAQSSCLVDQRELIERNAVTNDTIEERSSDIIVDDDWNQSDNGFTKKDRGEVVCDGGFASSSTTSALNSSMFSVISPDTISEKVNGNGNEDIASHRDNRGDIVIDQNPIQRKLRYDNEAAVEGVVSEEDTQQPQNAKTTKTQFKDIIGHQSVKLRLDEVLLPLALPANLSRTILKGVRSLPASILLYGPPGCGKTQLAKAVAGEAHAAFLSIGPSDILSKYVGESEEAVRSVFAEAVQLAGNNRGGNRCAVLFFDEIDALGRSRGEGSNNNGATGREGRSELSDASGASDNSSRRILAELLIQLTKVNSSHGTYDSLLSTHGEDDAEDEDKDGEDPTLESRADEIEESHIISSDDTVISQEETKFLGNAREQHNEIEDNSVDNSNHSVRVIVIAATNRPEDCDPALIRRFAVQVQVGLPTAKDRRKMLKRSMEDIEHTITKQQFSDLSLVTDGWSGSDIQGLAREAAMAPVRECIRRAAQMKRRRLNPNPHRRKKKIDSLIAEQAFPKEDMERERHNENNNTYQIAPERHARDNKQLLEEFRNLRPVKLQDYTKALAFWFNRMYDNLYDSPLAEFGWMEEGSGNHDTSGNCRLNEHYDSSSDEDDDEEFTNQPAE